MTLQNTIPLTDHPDFSPHRSYSQSGEDMLLRPLLSAYIPDFTNYKGCYVDIGAYHPYRFSNTMHFYELGWHGINIEPSPDYIGLFNEVRGRDINLHIGIGDQHETRTLYQFSDASVNTFDKQVADTRVNNSTQQIAGEVAVDIYPLADVLDKHLTADTAIDFMNIDIAGLDVKILQSNNWEKYAPRFVLVEDADADLKHLDASELHGYLSSKGYELVSKTLRTLIYQYKRDI